MIENLGVLGVGVVVFASTNVDDVFLLAAFFADRQLRAPSVVLGQFLGIGALTATSAAAAWASIAVPEGYAALLGVVPLALGLHKLRRVRRGELAPDPDDDKVRTSEQRTERRIRSHVLAVAGVTVANGGDDLGVYIPLFAREPRLVPLFALVFAAMTALWCFVGFRLARHRVIGLQLRRYGHVVLPIVLMALGVWILFGARVLLP